MNGLSIRRIGAVMLRQFYLLRGSFARILPIFTWIVVDIVLWGFITRYLNEVSDTGLDFVPALLGAVLLWDFFTRIMHGIATAFLEDVWSRNFLNVFATPLRIAEYLTGLILTSIGTSLVGLLVMMVLATAIFGLTFAAYGAMLVPFLLVLFLFGISLGIVCVAMVLRLGPASEWFVWPLPALITPFAGVFYPIATLPGWMQAVAVLLPPSYVFEGMRTVLAGGAPSVGALLGSGLLAIAYILLACVGFLAVHRYAVRTGLLARYSAESAA
ncbi:MAG TPA: ABC transporter permease [Rhodothermales bacterium]